MRRLICICLAVLVVLALGVPAVAAEKGDIAPYAKLLLQYYRYYGEAAEDVIWDLLQSMEGVDPDQAAVWRRLMANWSRVNTTLPVSVDAPPEGLPEDGTLAIVVLGYALNSNGTMRPELVDRLEVALHCAKRYPNAPVVVTGGQTGAQSGFTEAGQMSFWLQSRGIDRSRIYQDTQSYSTIENACNTYALLRKNCPQVTGIVLVTSDYHLTWGAAAFAAQSDYSFGYEGGSPITVEAGAVCSTGKTWDTMTQQAYAISVITGIPFDETEEAPALYSVARPVQTEPASVSETQPLPLPEDPAPQLLGPDQGAESAQEPPKEPPVLLIIALPVLAAWVLFPKKPRKKRPKPQWNWEGDSPGESE